MKTSPTEFRFRLTRTDLVDALGRLANKDAALARGLQRVGYPDERRSGSPSYEHLLRIIAGQQLSVKAAATIFGRLAEAMGHRFEPKRLLAMDDETLRGIGLSRQKIDYARGLSRAVRDGELDPPALATLGDDEVLERITELKGFGRWSAEMFLLFALGRPDVWPADDLGIQSGLHRLLELDERPDRKRADELGERWRPHRGAVAIFLWHYHANAPM